MAVMLLLTAVFGVLIPAGTVYAADAYAAFGSTSYVLTESEPAA